MMEGAAVQVVQAPSAVDPVSAAGFARQLEAVDPAASVLVDCSQVEFMDSSGLTLIVQAWNRHEAAGGTLQVGSPSPVVRRLFEITDLLFLIADDQD